MNKTRVFRRRRLAVALPLAVTLIACGPKTEAAAGGSYELLQSGSQQICVAPEVQRLVREAVLPQLGDLPQQNPIEQRRAALATLQVSFEQTTLQSFDPQVHKAFCSTTVRVFHQDRARNFGVDFTVLPAAESSGSFVVNAEVDSAKAFALDLSADAIDDLVAGQYVQQQDEHNAQTEARIRATVNPNWLVGTWIKSGAPSSVCASGEALIFASNHTVEGQMVSARWALSGTMLHVVGQNSGGSINSNGEIVAADAVSFSLQILGEDLQSFRRCTRDEVEQQTETPSTEEVDNDG